MKSIFTVVISAFCFSSLLVGCASSPKRMDSVQEGNWKAKALIKDKEQGRSYIVQLNFNWRRADQALRMDVTTALGTGVASLVVDQKEVRYILIDSKRFFFGPPQSNVMRPILSIPLDPRWIDNLLMDEAMNEKSWTCTKDSSGFVADCKDSVSGIKVTWSARRGEKKTVFIEHQKASVQINVLSFKPKVEDRKNLFTLEAPQGYQKLRVR